jgi:hypothetical protein
MRIGTLADTSDNQLFILISTTYQFICKSIAIHAQSMDVCPRFPQSGRNTNGPSDGSPPYPGHVGLQTRKDKQP